MSAALKNIMLRYLGRKTPKQEKERANRSRHPACFCWEILHFKFNNQGQDSSEPNCHMKFQSGSCECWWCIDDASYFFS